MEGPEESVRLCNRSAVLEGLRTQLSMARNVGFNYLSFRLVVLILDS